MISIVIPLLNEEGNLKLLHQKLTAALTPLNQPYEIIFINDGSTDNSAQVLESLFELDPDCRRIMFDPDHSWDERILAEQFQY